MLKGVLTVQEARNHPQRNLITRALGTDEQVEVDLLRIRPADRETCSCCAATDSPATVSDREIAEILNSRMKRENKLPGPGGKGPGRRRPVITLPCSSFPDEEETTHDRSAPSCPAGTSWRRSSAPAAWPWCIGPGTGTEDAIVAVKVLRPEFKQDAEFLRRFNREAEAASKVSHENIVNMYDVGADGDTRYIVMEYVDGTTLKEMIRQTGPSQSGRSGAHGHSHSGRGRSRPSSTASCTGISSPRTFWWIRQGNVKVADFGIARHEGPRRPPGWRT